MELAKKLNRHFRYHWDEKSIIVDTRGLLEQMPSSLRLQVAKIIYKDLIDRTPFFNNKPVAVISTILKYVLPIKYRSGDAIGNCGEPVTYWMVIKKGSANAVYTTKGTDHCLLKYSDGTTIGEIGLLFSKTWAYDLRASSSVEIFYVSKRDILRIWGKFQKLKHSMRTVAIERINLLRSMIESKYFPLNSQWLTLLDLVDKYKESRLIRTSQTNITPPNEDKLDSDNILHRPSLNEKSVSNQNQTVEKIENDKTRKNSGEVCMENESSGQKFFTGDNIELNLKRSSIFVPRPQKPLDGSNDDVDSQTPGFVALLNALQQLHDKIDQLEANQAIMMNMINSHEHDHDHEPDHEHAWGHTNTDLSEHRV